MYLIDNWFYFCCIGIIIRVNTKVCEDIMRTAKDNLRFFEDMARLATGAVGSFGEIRQQIKTLVKERMDQMMADMDMVTRAEFDRVKAMAEKARLRQEELEERLHALEKGKKSAPAAASKKKKPRK
jgi:BMFP domain-containing protein YqiC